MHPSEQDLALDCYTSFFTHLYQSSGPLHQYFVSSQYPENKLKFISASILTRSRWILLLADIFAYL